MATRPGDRRAQAALAAATMVLLLAGLGATDLWAPDEPRIGQISEELRSMQHGAAGLVLLHANGQPYTQKPPLYYWLAAGFGALRGAFVGEWAARLPSALAGLACVWGTVAFGRSLFGDLRVALWSGALLLTVFRFAHLARRAQFDVLLTLLEGAALFAFWRIETGQGKRTTNLVALHAALGLALLTKGPVGLLPFLGIAAYLVWEKRGRELRALLPPWSLGLSLLPAALWGGAAIALAPDGFVDEAIGRNLIGRFFGGASHARPFYYFALQFPLDFLPWTLLWPLAAASVWPRVRTTAPQGRERRGLRLLLAWIGVCLVFFSLSTGKRGLYLLPIFPATALLCAHTLAARLRDGPPLRVAAVTTAAVAAAVAGLGLWIAATGPVAVPNNPGFEVPVAFGVVVAALALGTLAIQSALGRRHVAREWNWISTIAALVALYAAVFWQLYPAFNEAKSPRPVARAALSRSAPNAPIGVFDQRALVEAVAYYAQRRVVHFSEPEAAVAFLDPPGRVLILRAKNLTRLQNAGSLQVETSIRGGRRELIVVRSKPPDNGSPKASTERVH